MSERPAVRRGEVWTVALDPVIGSEQAKTRPCIVVQRDIVNAAIPTTIVVPCSGAAGAGTSVVRPLLPAGAGGLVKASVALCNQVRVVDRLRMRRKLGALDAGSLHAVRRGLLEILDLDEGA